ncbi:hypothetical protein NRF20_00760 [Streptomyces sp. R-74717]|uniref:hypothetical protein n=1 Tax=Streptomyces TaxID=1883 RepID=UPI0037A3F82A
MGHQGGVGVDAVQQVVAGVGGDGDEAAAGVVAAGQEQMPGTVAKARSTVLVRIAPRSRRAPA